MCKWYSYRFRLGIKRGLTQRGTAFTIGFTLHSGVENCNRFEPPPPFLFKIGVVVAVAASVVPSARFITFISIRSFAFEAMPAAMADVVAVDGAAFAFEFVLIAIFTFIFFSMWIQFYTILWRWNGEVQNESFVGLKMKPEVENEIFQNSVQRSHLLLLCGMFLRSTFPATPVRVTCSLGDGYRSFPLVNTYQLTAICIYIF